MACPRASDDLRLVRPMIIRAIGHIGFERQQRFLRIIQIDKDEQLPGSGLLNQAICPFASTNSESNPRSTGSITDLQLRFIGLVRDCHETRANIRRCRTEHQRFVSIEYGRAVVKLIGERRVNCGCGAAGAGGVAGAGAAAVALLLQLLLVLLVVVLLVQLLLVQVLVMLLGGGTTGTSGALGSLAVVFDSAGAGGMTAGWLP